MEVIFLADVKGVARAGEVKPVSDGYARNWLLPKKLAEVATPAKVAALKNEDEQQVARQKTRSAEMAELVSGLAGKEISIVAKANPKGGLFAMVSPEDIIKHLGVKLSPEQVFIPEPIKTVGEHPVEVRAGETTATIRVHVEAK